MIILGLGGLLGEAACALLKDGELLAAVEEKKLTRRSNPGDLPEASIRECLHIAAIDPAKVDVVALVRPFASGPEQTLHMELREHFPQARLVLIEHHQAHAASAFHASPFSEATVLTLDRAGDFRCGAVWHGSTDKLALEKEIFYPDSLGDFYGRVTDLLGFEANAEEHKVQWLSTSGDDRFVPLFLEIIGLPGRAIDGSYFDANRTEGGGFSGKFYRKLGLGDSTAIPEHLRAHIASGLQGAVEQIVAELAGSGENLCLAGGLFYNALLVASLERGGRWKNVFVQPAAGNAGTAIGAVYQTWHGVFGNAARPGFSSMLLGPRYGAEEIKQVLENCKLSFRYLLTEEELIDTAVRMLGENRIVAWMHGRMEFGPRALGNRSILASPLDPYSTENLNIFIKRRESFRKFAASVPAEVASEYFEVGANAHNLATVSKVKDAHRNTFEAAVLGDGFVRVHAVEQAENPLYHRLLLAAGKATGLPVLYNTSFNLFGDPLVCNPRDAVRSFYSSGVDALFVGNFLLVK